jgi:phosphoserine phosphatase RsbU/P
MTGVSRTRWCGWLPADLVQRNVLAREQAALSSYAQLKQQLAIPAGTDDQTGVRPRCHGTSEGCRAEVITQRSSVPAEERLRDIQSITDAALSRLDDHELLTELLERTRNILSADTAAVLLVDYAAGQLVAAAAAGLEDEVRQGVRLPIGLGFAGRIAAQHKPVVLNRVDHTTVLNPVLVDKGIRAIAGVPLIAGGRVIGVLHVGSLTPRTFSEEDVALLQLAGDRAAAALQSLSVSTDRIASAALQRSLLPSALPTIAGAELAARFVPGSGVVGGDWYDVFTLPSGELCIVVGDVAGSGLAAAVIMGRMRSALRAYALETRDPADALARLDNKMQHFEPGALATVLYAVFDIDLAHVTISLAGHPAPCLAVPGQATRIADVPAGLMIGVDRKTVRRSARIPVPPGALLCFFTDGLVERRGEPIDEGLARLGRVVTPQSPEAVCAAVMGAMVGDQAPRDDIALLIFRRAR